MRRNALQKDRSRFDKIMSAPIRPGRSLIPYGHRKIFLASESNGAYLSVNMAGDGFSMPRAILKIDSFPRQRGKVGMAAMPPAKTPPSQPPCRRAGHCIGQLFRARDACVAKPALHPPRMRGKELDRHAISVIDVEKLPIGRLSKCHSPHGREFRLPPRSLISLGLSDRTPCWQAGTTRSIPGISKHFHPTI